MPRAEAYRQIVTARAGGICEYCLLVEAATGVTFHIEHVIPRSVRGPTNIGNLALSCPGCNLAKAERVMAKDSSGQLQPLFNPRRYEPWLLGWHIHFALDRQSGVVMPRSPIGEATAWALGMNDANRLFARKLQLQAGLIG